MRIVRGICAPIVPVLVFGAGIGLAAPQAKDQDEAGLRAIVEQLQKDKVDLQRQIDELRGQIASLVGGEAAAPTEEAPPGDELDALRAAAAAVVGEEVEEVEPEAVEFKSRTIGLQALNPEISVVGDLLFTHRCQRQTPSRADTNFRTAELAFESYLDPYSRLKVIGELHGDEAELGEAYLDRYGITDDVNLTIGKFRQQFGVVNRWHKHALDQSDFPLPLRSIFGPGGLNQTGLSLVWNMPKLGGSAQELTLQVTDGESPRIFGENGRNFPSTLVRYKNFRDVTKDTYVEFGLTALAGKNDSWPVQAAGAATLGRQEGGDELMTQRGNRWARVYGADVSVLWEPTERMRYRNFLARTELYWARKGILAPDDSGSDTLDAWGLYTNLQSKISRTVDVGLRTDFFKPDTKSYADIEGANIMPLAVTGRDPSRWLFAPYVTWWQSPWVKCRVEYNYEFGNNTGPSESQFILQSVFAAGPHKHESY